VSDDRLHVTLRFFGDTAPDREQAIIRAMQKISFEPFALQLRGVGHFPPRREARILWVGIDDQPVLLRLQSNIERACVNAGFSPDRRKFSPHITVARLTGVSPDRVAQFIVTNSLFATEHFEIHEFHLYSSCLGKDGAKYTKEVTFLSSRRN
jgi:2'-5' RNA ligase